MLARYRFFCHWQVLFASSDIKYFIWLYCPGLHFVHLSSRPHFNIGPPTFMVNLISTDGSYHISMMTHHVTAFSGFFRIFTGHWNLEFLFGNKNKNSIQYLLRWLSWIVWSSRFNPILFHTGLEFEISSKALQNYMILNPNLSIWQTIQL